MTFFGTDSILTLHIKKLGCYVFKEIHMAFCRYTPPKDFTKYLVAITDHVVITDQPDQYRAYRESLRREGHDPFYFYGRYPAEL